jgi:hypothetical protein
MADGSWRKGVWRVDVGLSVQGGGRNQSGLGRTDRAAEGPVKRFVSSYLFMPKVIKLAEITKILGVEAFTDGIVTDCSKFQ